MSVQMRCFCLDILTCLDLSHLSANRVEQFNRVVVNTAGAGVDSQSIPGGANVKDQECGENEVGFHREARK